MTSTIDETRSSDQLDIDPTERTRALLPAAGPGRWWRVQHRRSQKYPISIDLMECQAGNRKALSRSIGFEYTIAAPERVAEAAELVLARVGDYERVVGDYGIEN